MGTANHYYPSTLERALSDLEHVSASLRHTSDRLFIAEHSLAIRVSEVAKLRKQRVGLAIAFLVLLVLVLWKGLR